ncbi:ferritin-like domain-containing protein [Magnetofaba australis]|uniref:Iminophenyl-pyruvate dimer synthase domain-containing protein n=1 Tax=Magnetofaba australis IT-1 TaxID=1434232 RepID=A0A1Y2K6Y2_9PROT|nr:ferritin-like protein [Magnetofaba australis]OSM05067.1 hypothetical protein MAIT1_03205 [Magnetofaba australis IT-1]
MTTLQEQKQKLYTLLQAAFELELSTIPAYFTAMASIQPGSNQHASAIIRSVMMEEMLHMVLAGNVLTSLGGAVTLNADHIPRYPVNLEFQGQKFQDRDFDVNLAPFSQDAIETFMKIELPTEFVRKAQPEHKLLSSEMTVPGITIGAFYHSVEQMLKQLCDAYPEAEVFSGDPAHQITENYYWAGGGQPVAVTNLASALEALNVIIRQGEGSGGSIADGDAHYFDQPQEVAHYFRFNEIHQGRLYQPGDTPKDPPSGAPLPVDYAAAYPIIVNAQANDYGTDANMTALNNRFNENYTVMLQQIGEAFNGAPQTLYTAITDGMRSLGPMAALMMSQSIAGDAQGRHGAPSFEWRVPAALDGA